LPRSLIAAARGDQSPILPGQRLCFRIQEGRRAMNKKSEGE
jgi:hypothetical protein